MNTYGPHVRIDRRPGPPPSADLVVMKRDTSTPDGWVEIRRFNDMSDDYAHINADECARATRRRILEGEDT